MRSSGPDLHEDLWAVGPPVLVVLPSLVDASLVVRAFSLGADACVRTTSSAEVTAHVGALLRRWERDRRSA